MKKGNGSTIAIIALIIAVIVLLVGDNLIEQATGNNIFVNLTFLFCSTTATPTLPTSAPLQEYALIASPTPEVVENLINPEPSTSASEDSVIEYQSCDISNPPCNYIVKENDYFNLIAERFYGNAQKAALLMNYNRADDGNYRALILGEALFVPALDNLPELKYPKCDLGGFPCQYSVADGDTYYSIAKKFYNSSAYAQVIIDANKEYNEKNEFTMMPLQKGIVLVLPVKY